MENSYKSIDVDLGGNSNYPHTRGFGEVNNYVCLNVFSFLYPVNGQARFAWHTCKNTGYLLEIEIDKQRDISMIDRCVDKKADILPGK